MAALAPPTPSRVEYSVSEYSGALVRFKITAAVQQAHPGIEDLLWTVGVIAKEQDPDIKIMGLHVRAEKHSEDIAWSGWAHPIEESMYYSKKLIHPAGRIDLRIGEGVSDRGIVTLFAHELRHIGQFHRGRRKFGYLTTEHMDEKYVEPDCYQFEEQVLNQYSRVIRCEGTDEYKDQKRVA